MELYIKVENGAPVEHPILGNNFRTVYPELDVDNLPETFARFERVPAPTIGIYEVLEGCTYEMVGSVCKDVWAVRAMTDEEALAKQLAVQQDWAANGYPSWVFVSQTCSFHPPVPMPTDGKKYTWDEPTTSWTEVTS